MKIIRIHKISEGYKIPHRQIVESGSLTDEEVSKIVKDAGYGPKEVRVYTHSTTIMIPDGEG